MRRRRRVRLAHEGERVVVDRGARILRPDLVSVGDDVRIDTGVVLSGRYPISIGDHVHIAAGTKLYASGAPLRIGAFANLSVDVKLFTASDDYLGGALTNPTVPIEFRDVTVGPIVVEDHAIVGAGSVVLPGVTLRFGAAVGALSLVKDDVPEGVVVAGCPARAVGHRDIARLRELEAEVRRLGSDPDRGPNA